MQIYWVDSAQSLAIVPRPRGGDWLEDELVAVKREGIDVLISLLTREEQKELGLDEESSACLQAGVQYMNFPIADRQVPTSQKTFAAFLDQVKQAADSGKSVGAHCRAGIGRSSLMIATILCSQGLSSQEAFQRLSSARGLSVPDTPEQVEWVATFSGR